MLTTDLALQMDPIYAPISRRFLDHPQEFADAFAKAWFKLTHRDMGPISRYLGPLVPKEPQLWQDPVPAVDHALIGEQDIAALKAKILASGLSISATGLDRLGVGVHLPRLRQARRRQRRAHSPGAAKGLGSQPAGRTGEGSGKAGGDPEGFQRAHSGGKKVSLADVIVLGGCAAIEEAAKKAGHDVKVPFSPGRTDASQEQTDAHSFAVLEPTADGFRNYLRKGQPSPAEELLVDRAQLLTLTAPEMTVLIGGMRALNANFGSPNMASSPSRPGTLTNDFFVNLLDMKTKWQPSSTDGVYEGRDRATGEIKWTATRVDLLFGSNSQLRAIAEVYAMRRFEGDVRQGFRGGVE